MDNNYQNLKNEILKVNQRIKEYLWQKKYLSKASEDDHEDVL